MDSLMSDGASFQFKSRLMRALVSWPATPMTPMMARGSAVTLSVENVRDVDLGESSRRGRCGQRNRGKPKSYLRGGKSDVQPDECPLSTLVGRKRPFYWTDA